MLELTLRKVEARGHVLVVVSEPKQIQVVMGLVKAHYDEDVIRVGENMVAHIGGGRLLIRSAGEEIRAEFFKKAVGYTAKFLPTGIENEWTVDPPEPPPPSRFDRLLREDL